MSKFVKANEATATKRRCFFHLVDVTDGITPETGEASGQPQVSTNGGAFTNTGIGTLTHLGNGRYYADLTQTLVATAGDQIETRFKSANTAECPGDSFQVVAFDPYDATTLGVGNLDAAVSTRSTFAGGAVASVTGNVGGNVTGSVGSVVGAVGSVTGNVGGNVTGSVGSVVGAVGSVTGAVGSVTGNVGGNVTGTVGSVVGAVGSVTGNVGGNVAGSVASVTGNVGGNVVGSVASVTVVSDKTGYSLATAPPTAIENADALLSRGVSNVEDTADAHSLCTIVLAMLESSMAGTTWTINKTTGTTFTTKTLTVDASADPITGVT